MDIRLGPGEAMVVAGPNGVGKSSLLRVAAGLLRPAAGTVERGPSALADENLALEPRRTLAAALGFWARLDGSDPAPAMEAMGLTPIADVPVRMLSTGQRKRAALARVIASGAKLWLLDEPANGLDADAQERLAAVMATHRAGGGAILAATHQPFGLGQAHEVWLG
jgi:heme exporter protein A